MAQDPNQGPYKMTADKFVETCIAVGCTYAEAAETALGAIDDFDWKNDVEKVRWIRHAKNILAQRDEMEANKENEDPNAIPSPRSMQRENAVSKSDSNEGKIEGEMTCEEYTMDLMRGGMSYYKALKEAYKRIDQFPWDTAMEQQKWIDDMRYIVGCVESAMSDMGYEYGDGEAIIESTIPKTPVPSIVNNPETRSVIESNLKEKISVMKSNKALSKYCKAQYTRECILKKCNIKEYEPAYRMFKTLFPDEHTITTESEVNYQLGKLLSAVGYMYYHK